MSQLRAATGNGLSGVESSCAAMVRHFRVGRIVTELAVRPV
jgi:hypothetical protein